MFPTFSGSSRRPRQVNLSGQNTNPFATIGAAGTQQAIAAAQRERQIRQLERDRLTASKKIQKTWRGHKVRRELAEARRKQWDTDAVTGAPVSQLLTVLMTFFSPRKDDDIRRLQGLADQISRENQSFMSSRDIQLQLPRLANITLQALEAVRSDHVDNLLGLLVAIVNSRPAVMHRMLQRYYDYLNKILSLRNGKRDDDLIKDAIRAPLVEHIGLAQNDKTLLDAYAAFSLTFLTRRSPADGSGLIKDIDDLATFINIDRLSSALISVFSPSMKGDSMPADQKLYLLAYFIRIHRIQQGDSQEPQYLRALSLQLSSSAAEIVQRIDYTEADVDEDHTLLGLTPFVKDELMSLVNQASIEGLLSRFDNDYARATATGEADASLLASYALTLLRIFPRSSDDIRMWLYRGSMVSVAGVRIPAVKFFWQAVASTQIFSAVEIDSKAALVMLQPQYQSSKASPETIPRDQEWRTILLFLELYGFVLRFTDDEEFLTGGTADDGLTRESAATSLFRESALPLSDVKRLSTFLRNLAFTAYYNSGELSDDANQQNNQHSSTYFESSLSPQVKVPVSLAPRVVYRPFAGIAGMTFAYVKTIVGGVTRMLYERNSRRQFLPKSLWLMTSRFDMEGFIPAVVAEEERRQEYPDDNEEGEDDYDFNPASTDREMALVGMSRPRRARQLEELKRQQKKSQRKNYLAQVGPRLEVLQNMPFSIPFETRVQIFRQFVYLDQSRRRGGNVDADIWRMSMVQQAMGEGGRRGMSQSPFDMGRGALSRHHAKIRRDMVFDDAFNQFYGLGDSLKEPIQITFVDKFDTAEAGIDGGGVTKEFLTSITNEAFRPDNVLKLFVANEQNLLFPNPSKIDDMKEFMKVAGLPESDPAWKEGVRVTLQQFEFLGRVIGKCLYEGILVDVNFAGFFLLRWAASGSDSAYRANINDLRDLDEGLYQGLLKLKNYTGDVQELSLDFTIDDSATIAGEPTHTITRELLPGGSSMTVTNANRPSYIYNVARHRLFVQPYLQTQAFLKGLGQMIKPSWLSMFNQSELQTLIGGDSSEIDVENLRSNTQYGGVYVIGDDGLEHPTVQLFWKVLKDMDDADRRKVLKYVTSTPRAPLLGFSQLNPRFSIRDAGDDEERLPSTSTCVNLLKLPRYSTATTLRNKLLYAVNSGAGFDLS